MTKAQLRKRTKDILGQIDPERKKQISKQICKELEGMIDEYTSWAVYIPFDYEVDISEFVAKLRVNNKPTFLAQIVDGKMEMVEYSANSEIRKGNFGEGIVANPKIYKGKIDVYLVPGLAFDKRGYRLGHGKGYYDRVLSGINCIKIGLSFPELIFDEILYENHDVKMDKILF